MLIGIPHSLQKMARQVRAIALCRPLLIAVDALNFYPNVFRDAFRTGIPRLAGQIGRMTLVRMAQYRHCSSCEIQTEFTPGAFFHLALNFVYSVGVTLCLPYPSAE